MALLLRAAADAAWRLRRCSRAVERTVLGPLRALHSGHIGDYIAWLTVGVATFGGILAAVADPLNREPG